jgi:hypothetical protein
MSESPAEEEAIARSIGRGRPLGGGEWVRRVVQRFGLQSTLRELRVPDCSIARRLPLPCKHKKLHRRGRILLADGCRSAL